MGSIAGIFQKEPVTGEIGAEKIGQMLKIMGHRGTFSVTESPKKNCGFGILCNNSDDRISKIACSKLKKQWVVLDGDIFSCKNGDRSDNSSISDAELILNLYQTHGPQFIDKIDGSFSIALYDGSIKQLLILRDRLGTRPLFYTHINDTIVFASEIKAILECDFKRRAIDLRSLNYFLSYGYIPNPGTLFASVKQVKSGHLLIFHNGKIEEQSYWKFKYNIEKEEKPKEQYLRNFTEIFENAVARRLKRYPNAGAFLSGGLDTSGVVAMMRKLRGNPFKVFTGGFLEKAYNEIDDAKIVSDYLGLEHYTTIVQFAKNFPDLLEKIVWYHDSPFADTSAIPSFFAAKLAKEHVNTVFTGDFPDQLIGGSGHHVFALAREKHDLFWKKKLRNKKLNKFIISLSLSAGNTKLSDKIKRFFYRETFSLEEQRSIMAMPVPPLLKKCLYNADLIAVEKKHNPINIALSLYGEVKDESLLNKLLYFDILSYAPDDLMVKVDRMCAAHGLNAISPFHDRELVEFIAAIPNHMKIRGESRKYIMREALRPMLPEQTLNKKKQGFAMPIGEWMVNQFSDYVGDVLLDSKTLNREYFDKKFMRKMVENFLSGKTDYASGNEATIISLITLELWHRMFVDLR